MAEWLQKAAQMARQQYEGGEDAPLRSAWKWLEDNLTELHSKATQEASREDEA